MDSDDQNKEGEMLTRFMLPPLDSEINSFRGSLTN